MNVLFIASMAVVAADPRQSRKLFIDAFGLALEGEGDGYYSSGNIPGSKHFGVWPLSEAAEACFARRSGPPIGWSRRHNRVRWRTPKLSRRQAANFSARALLLHPAGDRTVARLLTEDGLIVGISKFHDEES